VDQGGGKRKGSIAVYLEPWHADVVDFLDLKKNHGNEMERARDLFYAMWVPDLFMKRVKANGSWSLFCPNEVGVRVRVDTGVDSGFTQPWLPSRPNITVHVATHRSILALVQAPGLPDVWGDEFEALYEKYEAEGRARKTMPAQELWSAILSAQVRPYISPI